MMPFFLKSIFALLAFFVAIRFTSNEAVAWLQMPWSTEYRDNTETRAAGDILRRISASTLVCTHMLPEDE